MAWLVQMRRRATRLRSLGLEGLLTLARHRLFGHRSKFLKDNIGLFRGRGLEAGGPSKVFGKSGYAPVYPSIEALDNVNFAARTAWEGEITTGQTFRFREDAPAGRQFVHEATSLSSIPDEAYEFVLSSNMLEHSANPIKALLEWKRVLKAGGTLLLVLPHKDGTFDRFRSTTTLEHMIDDFRKDTQEDDRTHIPEVLEKHDLSRDLWQESREEFRRWIEDNVNNRGLHHHVFDSLSAPRLVDHAGFRILCVEPAAMDNIFLFARKPLHPEPVENGGFCTTTAAHLATSPFRTDRLLARNTGAAFGR